ncbi:T9SS type A sorting domain-containing protein [Hymenobacter sp. UV11]|uniref:T9SS type A sorting domain-containing protein n=1 Tax=Hymenobacter sp. UV11 TaxID=1849735 RepID=UPI001414EACA|nr:T9SS type A sorting domain-containing protein [Hymenobacter sp. UV11]
MGTGFNGAVTSTVIQADGKIVVGGSFTAYNGVARNRIARLNLDGSLDASFAPTSTGLSAAVNALTIQSDGKIVVGGSFTTYNGVARNRIARLNLDGSLDASFSPTGTGLSAAVNALAIQSDGKIVVGGSFTTYNGVASRHVARLGPDGSLDTSFALTGMGLDNAVYAVVIQSDGKVVIGGNFTTYDTTYRDGIARLLGTGALDTGFTPPNDNGQGHSTVQSLAIQADGKILVGGNLAFASGNSSVLVRLSTAGIADFGFNSGITDLNVGVLAIGVDGADVYAGVWGPASPSQIIRVFNGVRDASFAPSLNNSVNALAVQSDGKIVAGGSFTTYNSTTRNYIARLTRDGGPDDTAAPFPRDVPVSYSWSPAYPPNSPNNNTLTVNTSGIYTATATVGALSATSNAVQVIIAPSVVIPGASNPLAATALAAGSYNKIIVQAGGIGKLTGDVTTLDSVVVKAGGTLRLGTYHIVTNLVGIASSFRVEPGATLSVGDPAGITTTAGGPGGGAVQTTTRSFAPDANYIYTGAASQVTGNGLPTQVRNLTDSTMQAGATLALSAPTSVSQVLTLASADDFNLNSQPLTLLSSASGTALVVNSPTGRVTGGTATVQRYIDPAFNTGVGARYYSPPVAGTTFRSLAAGGFVPTLSPPNIFSYDPNQLTTPSSSISSGLVPVTDLDAQLVVGKGYAVNLSAKDKVNFTGSLTTGSQSLNLTRTTGPRAANAGWNLVGNPYPAPLDWSLVTAADRPNVDAAIYTYVSTGLTSGFYTTYVNGWGDTPIIAMGQSFFVRATDNTGGVPSLIFRNSQRVTSYGTPASFNRVAAGGTGVALSLSSGSGGTGGGGKPPTVAYADNSAQSQGFNPSTDAYRIPSTSGVDLSISAPTQADELSIKAYSALTTGMLIPLTVRVSQPDTYTLQAITVQNLPAGVSAFLDDNVKGISVNLSSPSAGGAAYSFAITAAQVNLPITGRFVLRFGPKVLAAAGAQAATQGVALYPNPAHQQVTVHIPAVPGAAQVQVSLFNELGQAVRQQDAPLAVAGSRLPLNVQGLVPGVYTVRLQLGGFTVFRRLVLE